MSKSTTLNVTLHHDGDALSADVAHPAGNTIVRASSIGDLMRIIREHGDSLRPVPTGNWETLLAQHRRAGSREDSTQASA